jgi:hypothetical protein
MNLLSFFRRLRNHRSALLFYVGISLLALGVWWISGYVRVIPTQGGCTYVRDTESRQRCVDRQLAGLVKRHGINSAFAKIDRIADAHGNLQNACHLAAHPYGEREGRTIAADNGPPPRYSVSGGFCSQGRFHGRLIGFRQDATTEQLASAYIADCGGETINRLQAALQCAHSYGHLFLAESLEPEESLDACGRLADLVLPGVPSDTRPVGASDTWFSDQARLECTKGVMMETGSRRLKDSLTAAMCDSMSRSYAANSCALSLPVMLVMGGSSDEDAVSACNTLRTVVLQRYCGYGVGASNPDDVHACEPLVTIPRAHCRKGHATQKSSPRAPLTAGLGDVQELT